MDRPRSLNLGHTTIQGTLSEILQHLMKGQPPSAQPRVKEWLLKKLLWQSRQNFMTRNRK